MEAEGSSNAEGLRQRRKAGGVFYTPAPLVESMVHQALDLARERFGAAELTVLDPACGAGAFTRRLAAEPRLDVYGVDRDAAALSRAGAGRLVHGDAIVDEPGLPGVVPLRWHETFPRVMAEGGFHVVIGNPPYRNVDAPMDGDDPETFRAVKSFLQTFRSKDPRRLSWADHYRRMCDLYHLFFIRGLWLLRPGGVLCLVTSRSWLEAWYADQLREHLAGNATLVRIADHGGRQLFPDTDIPVSVLLATKDRPPAGHRVCVEVDGVERSVAQSDLGRTPWLLRARPAAGRRLGDLCDLSQGMQTGCNAVFADLRAEDVARLGLEDPGLRRRAVGSDIHAGRLGDVKARFAVWTEDHATDATLPPRIGAWLSSNRASLVARAAYRRGDCEWYRWSWPRPGQLGSPKLMCPYRARTNRFWFDESGDVVGLTDTTVLLPKPDCPVSPSHLERVLNDEEHTRRQRERAKLTGGGLLEYFAGQLAELPVEI